MDDTKSIRISGYPFYKIIAVYLKMFSDDYVLTNRYYMKDEVQTSFNFKKVDNAPKYLKTEARQQYFKILNESFQDYEALSLQLVCYEKTARKKIENVDSVEVYATNMFTNMDGFKIINNFISGNSLYGNIISGHTGVLRASMRMYNVVDDLYNNKDSITLDFIDKIKFYESNTDLVKELVALSFINSYRHPVRLSINNFHKLKLYTKYLENLDFPTQETMVEFIDRLLLLKSQRDDFVINCTPLKIYRTRKSDPIKISFGGITLTQLKSVEMYKWHPNIPLCFILAFMEKANLIESVFSTMIRETIKGI